MWGRVMRVAPAKTNLSDDDLPPNLRPFIEVLFSRDCDDPSNNTAPIWPRDASEKESKG
jgi:hypothetical protein